MAFLYARELFAKVTKIGTQTPASDCDISAQVVWLPPPPKKARVQKRDVSPKPERTGRTRKEAEYQSDSDDEPMFEAFIVKAQPKQ